MSDFKAKMHQIRFLLLGLCPRPRWRSLLRFLRPLARFKGPTAGWWRGTVVERRSLAGELSLSCARPAADG